MTPDVLLINPYYAEGGNNGWSFAGEHLFSTDQVAGHLGLGYLGAALRARGYGAEVLDADLQQLPPEAVAELARAHKPTLIGLTVCNDTYLSATRVVDALRATLPTPIIVGGPLARAAGRNIANLFPSVDAFALGEGERSILAALEHYAGQSLPRNTKHRSLLHQAKFFHDPIESSLDTLANPLRDDLPIAMERQQRLGLPTSVNLLSSRGCPGKCSFCTIADYGRQNPEELSWRPRSAADVVAEMADLQARFSPDCQFFMDDVFLCGHRGHVRGREIAAEITRRNLQVNFAFSCRVQDVRRETLGPLRDAGLYNLSFGVETIDIGSLRLLQKANRLDAFQRAFEVLEDLGISVSTYMMLYHPYTSIEEIAHNYAFLQALGSFDFSVAPDRRAFELLFQCKTTVRKFGALERELGEQGLLRDRSLDESLPLLADYDFADRRVGEFIDRLRAALHRSDRTNLVQLFERTLRDFTTVEPVYSPTAP